MRAIAYIIPGYSENPNTMGYRQVMKLFKRKHIKPVLVNIHWKYHTLTDYLSEFLSQYKPISSGKIYLFGFSFGAMIALLASPLIDPDKLYLCSLSPFFKEDLPHIKKAGRRALGKKRIRDIKTISVHSIARQVSCATVLVTGDQESAAVLNRSHSTKKEIHHAKFYLAKGAAHNLSQMEYIRTLRKII